MPLSGAYCMADVGVGGTTSEPAAAAPPSNAQEDGSVSPRNPKDPTIAAAALAAFCDAVAAVRAANSRGDDEKTIEQVKTQLAAAFQKARRAGVPQAKLLEASKEQGSTEEGQQLRPGDSVEVFGLESESGRQLNGQVGVVSHYVEEKGRFEVQLQANGSLVRVRPANLRCLSTPQPDTTGSVGQQPNTGEVEQAHASEELPQAGDHIEVHGLESESGKKLNGRTGVVRELVASTGRFKVELSPDEVLSIKPENLRRRPDPEPARNGAQSSRSGSSSSSSSSSQPRRRSHKRASNFNTVEEAELAPEEKLEQLLGGLSGGKKKKRRSRRTPSPPPQPQPREASPEIFFGAAAAEAAQAASAGAAAASAISAETAAKVAAAAAAAVAPPAELRVGDQVEVYGLQSEAGRKLNGKTGQITKFVEAKGRFEVELGLGSLQSLKPENLRPASRSMGGDYSGAASGDYNGATAGYTLL